MAEKKKQWPKTIGACVDLLYNMRAERLELQKAAEAKGAEETQLRNYLLDNFAKSEIEGAKGKVASAGIVTKTVCSVTDWDAFHAYVAKTKAWDLLQKRVNDKAYIDRLEKGPIPGAKPETFNTLSLTKVR